MKTRPLIFSLLICLVATGGSLVQQTHATPSGSDTMVGKETAAAFTNQNKQGAAAVSAVSPTPEKLSSTDQALMLEVAKGGMMQLELGKVAAQKASNPEVRQLAQAEVEEQTTAVVSKLQGMSGLEFDRMYVQKGGTGMP